MARWSEVPDHIDDNRVHDQTASPEDPSMGEAPNGGVRPIGDPPSVGKDDPTSDSEEGGSPEKPSPATAQEAQPDFRSKTERRFARQVQRCERVEWWAFEPTSFRIGPQRHYRPDFLVQRAEGALECIEVKGGYVRDRALVKPSAAARLYPQFDWAVVQQAGKTKPWTVKEGWILPNRASGRTTIAETICDTSPD